MDNNALEPVVGDEDFGILKARFVSDAEKLMHPWKWSKNREEIEAVVGWTLAKYRCECAAIQSLPEEIPGLDEAIEHLKNLIPHGPKAPLRIVYEAARAYASICKRKSEEGNG